MTDDVLIQLLHDTARQDRAAFRAVYRMTSAKLSGVLTRMLRDRSEVEDALQDVYVRVWQRAAQFDASRGAAMGWLITIARNVALDRLRARPEARGYTHVTASADAAGDDPIARLPAQGVDAEAQIVALDDARRVIDCLNLLQDDRAAAVRGAYLQGLSYQELAERHAVPLNTMRTWLRRSLLRLKECLDQ
ncbi:MAG: sigma-70 family RNA polymerase sigma factor [Roseinatronobacter sp.]